MTTTEFTAALPRGSAPPFGMPTVVSVCPSFIVAMMSSFVSDASMSDISLNAIQIDNNINAKYFKFSLELDAGLDDFPEEVREC
jgi:hypothetical protein